MPMKIYLIFFTIIFPILSSGEDLKFAFPFGGNGCSKNKSEVCLTLEQKIGEEVTLLEKDKNQICHGKVISHFTFKDEILSFKASKVKTNNCRPSPGYQVAIVGKKINSFEYILPKSMEKARAQILGKEIFESESFQKFLRESESIKSYVKGKKVPYTSSDFSGVVSVGRTYTDKELSIDVISQHLFKDSSMPPGAMFAVIGKDKFPISDLCVSGQEVLMKIEGHYYFYTKSQGCDTDYVLEDVYRVKEGKTELVLRDSSWSL